MRALLPSRSFSQEDRKAVRLEGFDLMVAPASHVGWQLYCFGTYESGLRPLMKEHVAAGAVCLEIGANIGWHTLLLSRLAGGAGAVHAFEPNPGVAKELRSHLDTNGATNVTLWQVALADKPGILSFQAPDVGSPDAGNRYLMPDESGVARDGTIAVQVETVDGLFSSLNRLDFIKIDVEGWEPAVWQGAADTLRRHRPVICLEQLPEHLARAGFSVRDATAPLVKLGYRFYAYDDRRGPALLREPECYEGDILALPPGRSLP